MSGTVTDAYGQSKKHNVMADTWGHMYPEPGSKHYGEMTIARGEYGDLIIVKSDFPGLSSSPQRYEMEHTIFDRLELEPGTVVRVKCGLWFYKTSDDMYLSKPIGKIINIQFEDLEL